MELSLRIDPGDAAPIWRQIEEGLRRLVASGALGPDAAVPSVRELARELRVNPATVSKAYQRLCDAEVLTVRRGEGTFVAAAPPQMANGERRELLGDAAMRYAALARTSGAGEEEAMTAVKAAWRALGDGPTGGGR
jgi:GntR family transcriptional regulator